MRLTDDQLLRILPPSTGKQQQQHQKPQQHQRGQSRSAPAANTGPAPEKLSLKSKKISSLPPLASPSVVARFSVISHLDLADNAITEISCFKNLASAPSVQLRHLSLAKNAISDLSPISVFSTTLSVLDVSGQQNGCLTSLAPMFAAESSAATDATLVPTKKQKSKAAAAAAAAPRVIVFAKLKAIIANDNALDTLFPSRAAVPVVDTLILSKNSALGSSNNTEWWSNLPASLRKLSVSHCGIAQLPPTLELPLLTELRLAHNGLRFIPTSVKLRSLQILDVSHNAEFGATRAQFETVAHFPFLKNLNFVGTAFAEKKKNTIARMFSDGVDFSRSSGQLLLFFRACFEFLKHLNGKPLPVIKQQENEEEEDEDFGGGEFEEDEEDDDGEGGDADAQGDMLRRLRRRVSDRLKDLSKANNGDDAEDPFADDELLSSDSDDGAGDEDDDADMGAHHEAAGDDAEEDMTLGHRSSGARRQRPNDDAAKKSGNKNVIVDEDDDDALDADVFLKRSGLAPANPGGNSGGSSKVVASVKHRSTGSNNASSVAAKKLLLASAAVRAQQAGKW